jgi:transcriptional regulator with XRE-family HTH domain
MQRSPFLNLALKTAILASGKPQKRIARDARIDETTLSHIVRGRRDPSPKERQRLAHVLGREESELFPSPVAEAMSA